MRFGITPIIRNKVSSVITVGIHMKALHKLLPKCKKYKHYNDVEQICSDIKNVINYINEINIEKVPVVLIFKGSNKINLARIVDQFLNIDGIVLNK